MARRPEPPRPPAALPRQAALVPRLVGRAPAAGDGAAGAHRPGPGGAQEARGVHGVEPRVGVRRGARRALPAHQVRPGAEAGRRAVTLGPLVATRSVATRANPPPVTYTWATCSPNVSPGRVEVMTTTTTL